MFEKYRQMCLNGKFLPGDVYDYDYGMGHVYNLATQLHYCVPWQLAKLEHIETSMRKMMLLAEIDKVQSVQGILSAYLKREISEIAELKEPQKAFHYFEQNDIRSLNYNLWINTVSPSKI